MEKEHTEDEQLDSSEDELDDTDLTEDDQDSTDKGDTTEDGKDTKSPDTVTIDGKQVSLEQVREWEKGYMRQDDYTRKTQEFARQRDSKPEPQPQRPPVQLTKEQESAKQLLEQMGVAFKDEFKPTAEQVRQLQERIEDQVVEKEMTDLRQEFELSKDQVREVVRFAYEEGLPSLKMAYKAMVYDQKIVEAKKSGQEEAAKRLQKRRDTAVESGSSKGDLPEDMKYKKGMSWDDVLRTAEKILD